MNARPARRGRLFISTVAVALLMVLGAAAPAALADEGIVAVDDAQPVALQAQGGKVYKSKRAAKKAVIAKVRSRWQKLTPKVKVEDATKKKNMNAEQKKAYKKYRRRAGKNANKYRYYIVTFTQPKFTVSARYRDGKGNVRKYSLTADADWSFYGFDGAQDLAYGNYPHKSGPEKYWRLLSVRKGTGTKKCSVYFCERHEDLTGTKSGDDDFGTRVSIETKVAYYKLKD